MKLSVLSAIERSTRPVEPRFWARVAVGDEGTCWPFKGYLNKWGYGCFGIDGGSFIASRVAFALSTRLDPGQMLVCHSCDNPACCNPDHLWLGTDLENNLDKIRKGRAGTPPQHGEHNPGSKLTEDEARAIKFSSGAITHRDLARRFNVCETTVSLIRKGKRWSHVAAHPQAAATFQ